MRAIAVAVGVSTNTVARALPASESASETGGRIRTGSANAGRSGPTRGRLIGPALAAAVSASETYNTAIEDELRTRLGVNFVERTGGRHRRPVREIAGIPGELLKALSSRRAEIEGGYQPRSTCMSRLGRGSMRWTSFGVSWRGRARSARPPRASARPSKPRNRWRPWSRSTWTRLLARSSPTTSRLRCERVGDSAGSAHRRPGPCSGRAGGGGPTGVAGWHTGSTGAGRRSRSVGGGRGCGRGLRRPVPDHR